MIKNLLDTLLGNAEHQLDDDDEKIALAALCVRVAKSDNDLSVTALPAIMISLLSKEILLKFFESLITTPLNCLSVINVFEPAPNTNIFS